MTQNQNKPYKIFSPSELFEGRSYSDLLEEFWSWMFSIDCDKTNIGDVVFLRGVEFPEDPLDPYAGKPVVRVGEDRLTISTDQAVFFCCYTTMSESIDQTNIPNTSIGRRNDVVLALNNAGIPKKEQIFIDGEVIDTTEDISDFRIVTREFMLNVPDPSSGKALGRYFELELSPGDHPSVAGGYCFLLKFTELGTHFIHCIGKGVPWQGGEYVTELCFEINVIESNRSCVPLTLLQSLTDGRVKRKIEKLNKENKLLQIPNIKNLTPADWMGSKLVDQSKWKQ